MQMRVPSGGSVFDALANTTPYDGNDTAIEGVTLEQLDQALTALHAGHIEYIVLADGEAFLQVAGEGEGPYQVEYNPGQVEDQIQSVSGASIATVAAAMRRYRGGDPDWPTLFVWQHAGLSANPGRKDKSGGEAGFLGRLLGRSNRH